MPKKTISEGISEALQISLSKKHSTGGICASFAFDWIKKSLNGMTPTAEIYTVAKRLDKIASRQKLQDGGCFSAGGLPDLAKGYKLKLAATNCRKAMHDFASDSDSSDSLESKIDALNAGIYYVSMELKGDRHGFAVDFRRNDIFYVGDVGTGTYSETGTSRTRCIQDQVNLFQDEALSFELYAVTLA
ncbi:hypothetical protein FNU76_21030 [Chitinimonas arctica]|uniref:Uncharacterized protein n=1 Tax=Chitinimonas arctica TaxID=2594795 RepID=A0A516SKF4_9NEIS|nr:hypothetical protein [Chitinimonas arctica]QDQ28636.1 hypothetical protein FNU76_21030 [Chitinimonas arctica]